MTEDFFKDINFNAIPPKKGKILISEPFLFDPNFKRTVILLVEHNKEGSVGFILNRSVDLKINDAIDEFPNFKRDIYNGGPVGQESLFYIHTLGEQLDGCQKIMKELYWGGDFDELKLLIDTGQVKPEDIRFFVGYSGWDAGQLDRELKDHSWIVANCNKSQIMDATQKEFWKDVLKGLGKKYAVMANFPEDPSLN